MSGKAELLAFSKLDVLASYGVEAHDLELLAEVHFVAISLEAIGGFLGSHPDPAAVAFFGHGVGLIRIHYTIVGGQARIRTLEGEAKRFTVSPR